MKKVDIDNKGFGFFEERSDKVREILGKAPNWMIRSGSLLIFFIILLLVFGSAAISYNEIIPARILITSNNPPINLKAKSSSQLKKVLIQNNEEVIEGQVLAELENNAELKDINYLESTLRNDCNNISTLDSLEYYFPVNLKLGVIKPVYDSFLYSYQNLISSKTRNYKDNLEPLFANNQLKELSQILKVRTKQLADIEQELTVLKSKLESNKDFLPKETNSHIDYIKTSTDFFELQKRQEVCLQDILRIQTVIINYETILKNSETPDTKSLEKNIQKLENTKNHLIVAVNKWRQDYLMVSPVDGNAILFDIWAPYQNITMGETVITVLPKNKKGIVGIVNLPINSSAKAKIGQEVLIKLDNYPFEEWGSLRGHVKEISEVPKDGGQPFYTMYVSMDSLKTSFDRTIPFKQVMYGNVEIIVEELTLLQRIFYQLRIVDSPNS